VSESEKIKEEYFFKILPRERERDEEIKNKRARVKK
jgi:hypothetical protein